MRHIVLLLSMATVVLFGYALAGFGGYLINRGRMDYIVFGLAGGFACAAAALALWKRYLLTWRRCERRHTPPTTGGRLTLTRREAASPDMVIFDVDGVLLDTSVLPEVARAALLWAWTRSWTGPRTARGFPAAFRSLQDPPVQRRLRHRVGRHKLRGRIGLPSSRKASLPANGKTCRSTAVTTSPPSSGTPSEDRERGRSPQSVRRAAPRIPRPPGPPHLKGRHVERNSLFRALERHPRPVGLYERTRRSWTSP